MAQWQNNHEQLYFLIYPENALYLVNVTQYET